MGRLSRCQSLKKSADFERAYRSKKRWHDEAFVLFVQPGRNGCRVGFVASKKLGNAVKRARAKRRLRALFSRFLPLLKEGDYVMVAKPPVLQIPFSQMQKAFRRAVKRLEIAEQRQE